ncbi:serine hydrolase [Rhodanobacter lindaniclasticus]
MKATLQEGNARWRWISSRSSAHGPGIPRIDQAEAIAALVANADAAAKQDAFAGALPVARGDTILLRRARAWPIAPLYTVTLDTKFRLGSMDKMFTAVATLQLVQAGKLSLDGRVGQYLPDYPNATSPR